VVPAAVLASLFEADTLSMLLLATPARVLGALETWRIPELADADSSCWLLRVWEGTPGLDTSELTGAETDVDNSRPLLES
jgi:hypothetical protein